jgi:ACR3 family arsenite efflux pump ArsB
MTITLSWWVIPIVIFIIGIIGARLIKDHGDYDFLSPFLRLGCVLIGSAAAAGMVIAKLYF